MRTSGLHGGIQFRYDCRACLTTTTVAIQVGAGDPLYPPEHFLPQGWSVLNGYPICPAHEIHFAAVPEGER